MPPLRGIVSNLKGRSGDVKPARSYVLRFGFGGGRHILVFLMPEARRFPPPVFGRGYVSTQFVLKPRSAGV
jgi:hypothetical protein